eukprot:11961894-Ditylum_brightwellii.AAC.1
MRGHLEGCGAIVGKYYLDWTSVVSVYGSGWYSDAVFFCQSAVGCNGAKESQRRLRSAESSKSLVGSRDGISSIESGAMSK